MNKQRKTSHILNVFQYDADGHVVLPASLTLGIAPAGNDNSGKVGTTAWVRTYVTGLSYLTGNQSITVSGDATGSGTTAITLTLANSGVTAGTYTKVTVDSKGRVTVGASATTTDIAEGTNLYYTDARVLAYLSANTYATQSYVGTQIANLVDSSPATLDTLNELAAALGDDPNFATTVATSIGTKQAQLNGTGFVKVTGTTVSYDNSTYALDSVVVKLTGAQTIAGIKTFQDDIKASNFLYIREQNASTLLANHTQVYANSTYFGFTNGAGTGSAIFTYNGAFNYTLPASTGTLALTSNLSSYLPLAGGTLTGPLAGTTSAFTGFAINATPASAGTGATFVRYISSGSDWYIGSESSVAGSFFGGASAYASVFFGTNPFQFITGGTKRFEIATGGVTSTVGFTGTTGTFSSTVSTGGDINATSANIKLYSSQNVNGEYRFIGTEYAPGNGNNKAEIRFGIDGSDTRTKISFHVANGGGTINEALSIGYTGTSTFTTTENQGGVYVTSATDNTTIRVGSTATGGQEWRLQSTGGTSGLGQGKLIFKVGGTETASYIPLTLTTDNSTNGGRMGIGTISPLAKLSIGSGSFSDSNVVAQMSTGGGGTGAYFGYNKNGTYGLLVGMSNGLDGWTAGVIRQISADPLYFIVNNNTIAMNITSGGNILIGTTNVDIGGSVAGTIIRPNGTMSISFNDSSPANYQSPYAADRRNVAGDGLMYGMWRQGIFQGGIGATSGQDVYFYTGDGGNSSQHIRMTIKRAGDVGIGITSPLQTAANRTVLTINGTSSNVLNFGVGGTLSAYIYSDTATTGIYAQGNLYLQADGANFTSFVNNGLERMRISNVGSVFYKGYVGGTLLGGFSVIGTISAINTGDRYLHVKINTIANMMYWIKIFGYVYVTTIIEGMSGGYIGGGTGAVQQVFANGNIVTQYQNNGFLEIVVDTINTSTTNRWGSITFLGGTDTIASVQPLEIMAYSWTASTARVY